MFEAMDIGTQMSLIRLNNGKFLVVDTCDVSDSAKSEIDTLTENGSLIEAVIATHPFHTMYFSSFYKIYPHAAFYGTPRHIRNINSIPWCGLITDPEVMKSWEVHDVYIRITQGADFVNPAMSALVYHQESRTLHDNDTINAHPDGTMDFHPQVLNGLFRTADGPGQFYSFIRSIIEEWDFKNLAAGHSCVKTEGTKEKLLEILSELKPKLDEITANLSK